MAHRIPGMALRYRAALYYKMGKASCFNRLFRLVLFSSVLFSSPLFRPLTLSLSQGSISERVRQGRLHGHRAKWLCSNYINVFHCVLEGCTVVIVKQRGYIRVALLQDAKSGILRRLFALWLGENDAHRVAIKAVAGLQDVADQLLAAQQHAAVAGELTVGKGVDAAV